MRNILNYLKRIKSKTLESFSYLLISQMIFSLCSFTLGIFCSRYYGPTLMGGYNYVMSYMALFSPLLLIGLDSIAVKDFSTPEDNNLIFGSLMMTFIIGQFIAIALCIVVALSLKMNEQKWTYLLLIGIPWVLSYLNIYKYYLISQSKLKIYFILYSGSTIIFTILKIISIVIGRNLYYYAAITCMENIASSLCMYIAYRIERVNKCKIVVIREKVRRYIKIGIPFVISSLAASVYMKIDQIMVGNILGDKELGVYSLTVSLSECWYIIPMALYTAMLPSLSLAYHENDGIQEKMQFMADLLGTIGYAAFFFVLLVCRSVIPLLYGDEYIEVGKLMIVYVIAGFFVSIGYVFSAYFAIKEKSINSMIRTLIGCVINIALNYVLIKRIGSMGAVIATVITQFTTGVIINAICSIKDEDLRKVLFIEWNSMFPFVRLLKLITKH